jgi:hypothetical protein
MAHDDGTPSIFITPVSRLEVVFGLPHALPSTEDFPGEARIHQALFPGFRLSKGRPSCR